MTSHVVKHLKYIKRGQNIEPKQGSPSFTKPICMKSDEKVHSNQINELTLKVCF